MLCELPRTLNVYVFLFLPYIYVLLIIVTKQYFLIIIIQIFLYYLIHFWNS